MRTLTKSMNLVSNFLVVFLIINTACNNNTSKPKESEKVIVPTLDLHTAVIMNNTKAIEQHIKFGSDLNVKEPMGGSTALISAALFGKTEIATLLIKGGANVNLKNNEGSTALHTAAFFCRTDIVEALLLNKADKSILNNQGSTAFDAVSAPFDQVKPIYDFFAKELAPIGLTLDYGHIENTRPIIAKMLKE